MYGAVGAKINSPYGKCIGEQQKSPLFSNKVMEEQSICLIAQLMKGNRMAVHFLTTKQWAEQLEQTQILLIHGQQNKYRQNCPNFECGDGETIYTFHLYAVIY